ncbi:DHA2 family efflux MFS transporter permease subunit [Corynebacterium amycolatum]|uniref:DHA2 family efflux MFS transporter permease subunit n=1 Tax=Corynebacterium amycolatum TaxID=43765 RepID=A0AAW9SR32_CORAY|nr:DHA2 family efflux MFS transporter permease subunit [Corynebacterium amycolatum]MDK7237313.1 DHA2 family efflux MFS transporter permease subunit [Corynebacterium amycolatum]
MAIYVLLAAAFMAILNETVMSVAIPVIKADLNISAATAGWLTTAFLLTMAVVIPVTGFLIASVRFRTLFAISQGLFVVGTLIGAFAPGFAIVLLARVVQASGTAVLLPLLMTTVLNVVPEHERGRMMGRMSIVIAVAPAIGPTVSGLILEIANNNWHALFDTMLPLGLIVLVVGVILVPNIEENSAKPIDILSVFLSAGAFGPLVYALSRVGAEFSLIDGILCAAGIVLLVLFIMRQRRLAPRNRALLDLRTFRTKSFTLSTTILTFGFMLMFGVIIILPLYLNLRGVDVKTIGLIVMPGPLIMGLMGPAVGRLFDTYGPRPLAIPGSIILALGLFGLGFISASTPLWWIVACHIVFEIGLGLLFTPLFTFGLGDLPKNLYPDGSAILNTLQQVAGAVGTALFVALSTVIAAGLSGAGAAAPATDDLIRGYSIAMFTAAGLGVVLIFLTTLLKPQRKKIALQ